MLGHRLVYQKIVDGRLVQVERDCNGRHELAGAILDLLDSSERPLIVNDVLKIYLDVDFEIGKGDIRQRIDVDTQSPAVITGTAKGRQMVAALAAAKEWNVCDPLSNIPPDAVKAIVDAVLANAEDPVRQRDRIAGALRDVIHEKPFSECGPGADTCPDWPLAYELADAVIKAS